MFIRTYYAISPTLVKWFGNTTWFKKLWKGKLDRTVAKLQDKGVENTHYEDKRWLKLPADVNVHKSIKNGQLKKTSSYGRIDISTIGGIFMPREYRHIDQYEKEISELLEQGFTQRQVGERLGFRKEQIKEFVRRKREKERKITAGIAIKRKGRPAKDSVVTEEDKLADLRYKLARKDARIKQLEMENELMRDFLSLTERK